MGRNLFRRNFLIFFLIPLNLGALTLPSKQNASIAEDLKRAYIEPLKDLRSEMIFSFPFEMNSLIEKALKTYTSDEKLAYLQKSLNRSAPFRSHIRKTIKKMDLPEELFYLPLVESAFRVSAVSRSGAVGLWQFMMNSIEPYDMQVSDWRDDRRDFWRATESALEKLLYNYEKTGSWDLALAAYNCGLNGLRRTMRSSGINDYWQLAENNLLPGETEYYLPKFLAISIICSYGGRYGLETGWEEDMIWERLELDHSIDLKMVSSASGIDYDLLTIGNAELMYHVTPPASSGYKLKIPQPFADSLSRILEESDSAFMEFYKYNIKTGDTLSEISEYYRVPLTLIYRYNEGISPRYLRTGQTLIIPALFQLEPYRSDEEININFEDTYIVQQGDSLWSISGIFEITPELLAMRNRISVNETLNIGTKLSVPLLRLNGVENEL